MAQAGSKIARRSLFAALLAAPIVAHPAKAAAMPPLKLGNIWVQVPEQAWGEFVRSVRDLNASGFGSHF